MSAVELREAAALMRERAAAAEARASEAPWDASGMWWYPVLEIAEDGRAVERSHGFHAICDAHGSGHVAHAATSAAAEYIASWDPTVARAVADWLDVTAEHIESHDCEAHCSPDGCDSAHAALAVARAYLAASP